MAAAKLVFIRTFYIPGFSFWVVRPENVQYHHLPLLEQIDRTSPCRTETLAFELIKEMMGCRGAFGLVCYDDNDNLAGAILGNPEIYFNCKQFFIKDFFVTQALQGKGIGLQLMAEFEKRLAAGLYITDVSLIVEAPSCCA